MPRKIELVQLAVEENDCSGCYFAVEERYRDCPTQCCLSTVDNKPVIYRMKHPDGTEEEVGRVDDRTDNERNPFHVDYININVQGRPWP